MWRRISLRLARLTWCSLFLFSLAEARTGAQLITDLRIMLGQTDSANSNWTNAQLRLVLNIAQDKVTARGRVIERDTTYAVSATKSYTPPSGFITLRGSAYILRDSIAIKAIPLTNSDSLPKQLQRLTAQSAGEDELLILEEAGQIRVEPEMNSFDLLKVVFFANPVDINDSTDCQYGDEWEVVLLYEAKMVALEKIRDETWYQLTMKERDTIIGETYKQTKLRPQLVTTP